MTARRKQVAVGGSFALVLAAIVVAFQWWRVCDEQLTGTGRVVAVCRHMTVTDPPVVAFGLAALILLSRFYAEISGFGVTLRRKVEELDQRSDALQETVGDLTDFNRERVGESARPTEIAGEGRTGAPGVPDPRIAVLADRYDRLRWTMPSGIARTRRMSDLFEQLQDVLRDVPDFDLAGHLTHHDRGVRLAAYAYLRQHVEPDVLGDLVTAAAAEDKPFGQFAGLRAALRQRDAGGALSGADRRKLRELRDRIGSASDRVRLVDSLLDEE